MKHADRKFQWMWRNEVKAEVTYNFMTETVSVINYDTDIMMLPFGVKENPTTEDLDDFMEDRCFPRTRVNVVKNLIGG